VFENRVLRRIFGPRSDEVTGEWRKLPSIIRMNKSRTLRLARQVARMGGGEETFVGY
jgi:hypothetical protein